MLRADRISSDSRPVNPQLSPPKALLEFVALFNRGEYWESHELLEGPWRESRSEFYHGLILYASAFVHVRRGNPRGIVAQLEKAERSLTPYRPVYLGFDVDELLSHSARCRAIVAAHQGAERAAWAALVPAIRLEPSAERVRGNEVELERSG
jgi:predicted metal-dependent hydrolase